MTFSPSIYNNNSDIYWHRPIEDLYQQLDSSPCGLTEEKAQHRLKNQRPIKSPSVLNQIVLLLWRQLKNPLLILLLFTCAVSLAANDFTDAIIMGLILLGSLVLSFIQEYRATIANERLQNHLSLYSTVFRSGKKLQIPSSDIVPGDVVFIVAGNLIPADGVLISSKDLFVNEAVLTGESLPTEKKEGISGSNDPIGKRHNCVFMGTSVRSGSAQMLVIQTGAITQFGKIATTIQSPTGMTKFEKGMRDLGLLLSYVMLVFFTIMIIANILLHRPFLETMLFALAIAVGISPQLLPAILSTTLSSGSQAMAKVGVLVKHLNAIENLGIMDVLCTDKTGTLTTGAMTVTSIIDMEGNSDSKLALYSYLNATMQSGIKNPLDEAIQAYGKGLKIEHEHFEKVDELPFDFYRKRLTLIVQEQGTNSDLMICKGAVEKVVEICDQITEQGQLAALTQEHRQKIITTASNWAKEGIRVIGIALKSVTPQASYKLSDEQSFVFHGFVLTADELRAETIETIKDLAQLGVSLKMITGDNRYVAQIIGKQIGLQEQAFLTGAEINQLSDEALWHKTNTTQIFFRG